MQVIRVVSQHRLRYGKARFLLPLLIPLLLGFATLHVITTLVIFVIVLVICSSIVITVAPTTCSLEKAFISKFSDRYKGLISDPYVIYKCFLVTLFSWYFTMLVPVNLENKLLYKEILVYNILFVICVHLVQIVRNRHSSGLLHLLPSSSQHYPVNPVKREKNLTLFGLWKHTFHLLQDTNKQQMEGDWYFSWLDIFVNRANRPWSIALLTTYVVFIIYSTNLALTSVCTPKLYFEWFLLPNDCTFIYDVYSRAWVFVTGLCWLTTSIIPISFLVHEIVVFVRLLKYE